VGAVVVRLQREEFTQALHLQQPRRDGRACARMRCVCERVRAPCGLCPHGCVLRCVQVCKCACAHNVLSGQVVAMKSSLASPSSPSLSPSAFPHQHKHTGMLTLCDPANANTHACVNTQAHACTPVTTHAWRRHSELATCAAIELVLATSCASSSMMRQKPHLRAHASLLLRTRGVLAYVTICTAAQVHMF